MRMKNTSDADSQVKGWFGHAVQRLMQAVSPDVIVYADVKHKPRVTLEQIVERERLKNALKEGKPLS